MPNSSEYTEVLRNSIAVAGVAISVCAVIASIVVNIFGDDLRSLFRRPDLEITLPDLKGEWTIIKDKQKQAIDRAIYFHAVVTNKKPARVAFDTELFLIECTVTQEGQSPRIQPMPCPLPIQPRRKFNGVRHDRVNIGVTPFAYDLFRCVEKPKRLKVLLNGDYPNNLEPWIVGAGELEFVIEARATNAKSQRTRLNVKWDGYFPEESEGLFNHFQINHSTYEQHIS